MLWEVAYAACTPVPVGVGATSGAPVVEMITDASLRDRATSASFTVTYDGGEAPAAIVADWADGNRTALTCDDAAIAHLALTEILVGQTVHIESTAFAL